MCIGVADVFPEAVIRQFVLPLLSLGSGAMFRWMSVLLRAGHAPRRVILQVHCRSCEEEEEERGEDSESR